MVALNPGRNVGVSTTPTSVVFPTSGLSCGLPPRRPLYWPAGEPGVGVVIGLPPFVSAQAAAFAAVGAAYAPAAHRSVPPSNLTTSGSASSATLGTRTARL